ncbi:MAG: preprotein translocase subunit SecG [Oscillospiraceae bacterium]|nr:preprotein translocase subunit SecG [Oscillospiraceae bacterium]
MGILEIVSAILLILSCVFIILMVLMQDSKKGMSQAISGGSNDNFYQRNSGRSKEARLARATRTAAILFFVVTLAVNVFAIYFSGENNNTGGAGTSDEDDYDLDDLDWLNDLLGEDFEGDGIEDAGEEDAAGEGEEEPEDNEND